MEISYNGLYQPLHLLVSYEMFMTRTVQVIGRMYIDCDKGERLFVSLSINEERNVSSFKVDV